jgi:hypothetical protein
LISPKIMQVETPEIAWHYDHDSTTSIDFHPYTGMFAVAGSDASNTNTFLRVWELDIDQIQKGINVSKKN